MDAKQLSIEAQMAYKTAAEFYGSVANTTTWSNFKRDDVDEYAEHIFNWIQRRTGNEGKQPLPNLPETPESKKIWCNFNSPEYNKCIEWAKQGYTVNQMRRVYMINNKVGNELEKLLHQ
jgi:hypothetical protein